ncbi:MAG: hypothetical protein ISR59_04410 [Anaerolineales bacterium]|uniref:Pyruvate kinase n=1 Tax=Candidatus Desulfolinea nitratireducens TaxID=2841698 RepID=A0A8J6NJI6_9CHLR|nr:hypothetical protein [Candidatus Desulfolinea nitratireducens]MBL6960329.1 hypothetical protein [Anaerolineales bacterium]
MSLQVIVTTPPYADYLEEIVAHPLVSGFRLNTIMPTKDGPGEAIDRLRTYGQPLWVDLKGRQLRIVGSASPPFTEIRISHPIKVDTPVTAFFSDGTEQARIVAVDGNRLILESGPRRVVGLGESINIIHPSLQILGTLTENDIAYLQAMKERGMKKVMLSYVEKLSDIEEVKSVLPDAEIILKIETQAGLKFAEKYGHKYGRLAAARGDLFIEVPQPHKIISALKKIIHADPNAIVASRFLDSLAYHPVPSSADISDVAFLLTEGYKTFMLGDIICLERDTLVEALNLLDAISTQI